MKLHVTYCSKDKDRTRKNLPAIKRYNSNRINEINALAQKQDEKFAILSAKYGLIMPQEEIPFYDELMREQHIPQLITGVKNFIKTKNVEKVIYHTKEVEGQRIPYFKLMKNACETLEIDFEKRMI